MADEDNNLAKRHEVGTSDLLLDALDDLAGRVEAMEAQLAEVRAEQEADFPEAHPDIGEAAEFDMPPPMPDGEDTSASSPRSIVVDDVTGLLGLLGFRAAADQYIAKKDGNWLVWVEKVPKSEHADDADTADTAGSASHADTADTASYAATAGSIDHGNTTNRTDDTKCHSIYPLIDGDATRNNGALTMSGNIKSDSGIFQVGALDGWTENSGNIAVIDLTTGKYIQVYVQGGILSRTGMT